MDRPHSNNSNNIHVTEAHSYHHSPQVPDKSSCNGDTGSGCFSLDKGYSSFNPEDSQPYHSTCNLKSEQNMGHFQTPGSVPNGPFTREPCHIPMQSPLQNGHMNSQPSQSYSGQGGQMHFSYSGKAEDRYQRPEPIPSGPPLTPYPQNGYQSHMQNGYTSTPSPQRCSTQGGPRLFSYSGEAVDEYQRQISIPSGPPLTPHSQNGYQSQVLDGPISSRPPPVVRKHSSFMRQDAIEEEIDDIDELNDSGFGSMRRMTSQEGVRRSRSRDVSDAPTDDVNNNLAPRKLERAHSSQDRTDNDLAQYQGEKRRCSSEQLQRSNGSSGYHSAGNLQGELPTGDGTKPCDIATATSAQSAASAEASAAASALSSTEYMHNFKFTLDGLTGGLDACKQEVWKDEDLHEEILSLPDLALQQLLGTGSEVHSQLMEEMRQDLFFQSDWQTSQQIINSNQGHGQVDIQEEEDALSDQKSKTSGSLLISPNESAQAQDDLQGNDVTGNATATRHESAQAQDDQQGNDVTGNATATREVHSQVMIDMPLELLSQDKLVINSNQGHSHVDKRVDGDDHLPKSSGCLLFSPRESAQDEDNDVRGNGTATRKVSGEELSKASLHGEAFDQATKDSLQTWLEKQAYCEAMEHKTCRKCHNTKGLQNDFEECYRKGKLDQCSDCREMVKAYWKHSKSCPSVRCVLPYCGYFKDLCSEKGLLHDPEMQFFEEALGCLIKVKEIDVLERLHELQQLQQPAANGEKAWSADANAESYLKKGQHYTILTTEARLCKFGHFSPIRCKARQHKVAPISVIIKKVRCYRSLTATLKMLHSKSQPVLEGIISTCLWYRQIKGEKLLVCSTYLSEKSLSSCLDGYMYVEDKLEKYWIEACKAAVTLHESGILYLNWKVHHLLVTQEDRVKLCNFDYAVDMRTSCRGLRGSEWRGTEVPEHVKTGLDPRIAPPEVLNGEGLTPESETWGLGCLLYQLNNGGCLPYPDLRHLSDDAIREKFTNGHSAYVPVTSETQMLSTMCWMEKKEERKLPVELVNIFNNQEHKVFKGICEETRYIKHETVQQEQ